ncbi:cytochrome P450 [Pareuzebyella sediminis]|uniref:cytochrome P450 n=1 Tax=Pareuzebyella sediminis TaxID=2607998 RepID=UPI001E363EC9|nr:cytochrome P450 [Pareuzebyella sediminis]
MRSEIPTVPWKEVLKKRKQILKNPLPFHKEYFKIYGDTFRVNLGNRNNWVFTRNPETIKYILQTNQRNYHKSTLQTKDLAKYVGHGLLTSNGASWRTHRRMIQPAFHKKKLVGLLEIMLKAVRSELKNMKFDKEYNIFPMLGDLAFQVVAQSLFSADDIRESMQRLKHITMSNQKMLIKEMRLPYLKWWFRLNGNIGKHLKMGQEARAILDTLLERRLASKVKKEDLLDMLLTARYEDGTPMSRKQLLDEVLILFVAGHETTANALGFTLLLLAGHPEYQEKLFDEVKNVDLAEDDLMAQLERLTFTKQCIEEAMRLYPPAYFFDRVSQTDDVVNGMSYKKGTVWLMSIYELHRHEGFCKNPGDFMPERFDAKNRKNVSDHYFPFGAGPRMCIGNNFAMYEMIMTVAILLKEYKITSSLKTIELNPLITLKPLAVPLKIQTR